MAYWLKSITPYVEEWTTVLTNMLSLLLIWTYSLGCLFVVSIIQRAYNWFILCVQGDLTVQAREEVSALMRRFQRGETIPPREGVSWLRRLDDKLRGVYAAVTCRRTSDVALPPPAHPRCPSYRPPASLDPRRTLGPPPPIAPSPRHCTRRDLPPGCGSYPPV